MVRFRRGAPGYAPLGVRRRTREEYEERLRLVIRRIAESLDAPADLFELADLAGFSRFHFHRIFSAMTGESVAGFQRRLRLEKAAWRLAGEGWSVGEAALDAGFDSPEAFCRAFRGAFGVPPSRFAAHRPHGPWLLDAPSSAHWPDPASGWRLPAPRGEPMQVEIRNEPGFRLAAVRHIGPYHRIGEAFDRLFAWARSSGVPIGAPIAVYHDDPSTTPEAELRSDAGIVVDPGFSTDDPMIHLLDVPPQRCAVAIHRGPYERLPETWAKLLGEWLPQSGEEVGDGLCYERYLNDCPGVAPDELLTEVVEPLR